MTDHSPSRTNVDPRRYHDSVGDSAATDRNERSGVPLPGNDQPLQPALHHLSAHLRRPRAEADMSWELFTRIVDQVPNIARVVLHGVGEPMLVKELPRMVRYLKARGAYVLFNTNGTVLTPRKGRELCDTGLDELRVSLDAADARTFIAVRGKDYFNRIVRNVRAFTEMQRREGLDLAARLALADRPQGDDCPASRFRAHRPRCRREGGLSAAAGLLRQRRHRHGAPGPGPVRAPDSGKSSIISMRRPTLRASLGISFNASGRDRARREPGTQGRQATPGPCAAVPGR